MAWRAHHTGISLVIPMYYGNEDASAFEAKDQYYFGSELLVAPITSPIRPETGSAVKQVWFPTGNWFNFFNGEQVTGGQKRYVSATLEDIPVMKIIVVDRLRDAKPGQFHAHPLESRHRFA